MHIDKPIIIALTLFIILLLIFFLVSPEYKKFKVLQTELGIKKAEYTAEFEYYSEIVKNYYQLKSRPDDIKKIDSALPSEPNLGKLVYYIQEEATKNGLVVKNLFLTKSSTSTTSNTIKDLAFSLSLVGNYSSLESFLTSLQSSARLFEIASISFGAGGVSSVMNATQFETESVFSFSMQINTHIY